MVKTLSGNIYPRRDGNCVGNSQNRVVPTVQKVTVTVKFQRHSNHTIDKGWVAINSTIVTVAGTIQHIVLKFVVRNQSIGAGVNHRPITGEVTNLTRRQGPVVYHDLINKACPFAIFCILRVGSDIERIAASSNISGGFFRCFPFSIDIQGESRAVVHGPDMVPLVIVHGRYSIEVVS